MAIELKRSWARDAVPAGEELALGNIACIKDDGKAYKADANDAALRPGLGVVTKGGALNEIVQVTFLGICQGYADLNEGQPVYLSESPGGIVQVAPTWKQQIGFALSASQVFFNFSQTGA